MGTHSLHKHVNLSIFCVSVVDTYNVATQSLDYEENSRVFFLCALSEYSIDNDLGSSITRPS